MQELFLKVLNMSITASYVILIILISRFLLKRIPKKYIYPLWSVVLFRLICPISFSSIISIFHAPPFNMAIASQDTGHRLTYIPSNIGNMEKPKVTLGISVVNTVVNENLPKVSPFVSINPIEKWIMIGTFLWCMGIMVIMIRSLIKVIKLKSNMSTAIKLKANIYESDKIISPFILGIAKPKIYIPFGLNKKERAYILRHENYHIKRKDHIIKLLSYVVLIIHWFNPFVWIAYVYMIKDMEMSCDEKVLTKMKDVSKEYSTSLLAFATNKKQLVGPLAFGESGIKERIKNILRFKQYSKRKAIFIGVICTILIIICAINPKFNKDKMENNITDLLSSNSKTAINDTTSNTNNKIVNSDYNDMNPTTEGHYVTISNYENRLNDIYGVYAFDKALYVSPLSSSIYTNVTEYYTLGKDYVHIVDPYRMEELSVTYEGSEVDEDEFNNSFMLNIDSFKVDISNYKERYQYTLQSTNENYRIYVMDDEVWLAKLINRKDNTEEIFYIFKLKKLDVNIPTDVTIKGNKDDVELFESIYKASSLKNLSGDTCYNISTEDIKRNSNYRVFKFSKSGASFLLYDNEVYPLGDDDVDCTGITSMELADLNKDGIDEFYFTYSSASNLHNYKVGYFDPVKKEVKIFTAIHESDEIIIAKDNERLSIYEATMSEFHDNIDFSIMGISYISDIVFVDGQIISFLQLNMH